MLTTAAALLFFVPPAVLLYRAKRDGDAHTLLLIRNLSALSLGLTVVLLVANFLTALSSEALGTAVHCLLTVVSAPMICSNMYILPLAYSLLLPFLCLPQEDDGKGCVGRGAGFVV